MLLEGSIVGTLLRLTTPNVLVMFVQASVGLIEAYFIAQLVTDALAGVALVFSVLMLMQMMSAGAMGWDFVSDSPWARCWTPGRCQCTRIPCTRHRSELRIGLHAGVLGGGPWLYSILGGREVSLAAALIYSNVVFSGPF